jgi:tRNA(fMet)-specific endonuclease VapC
LKYLLDTNIISELVSPQPSPQVATYLKGLDESTIYLSVITIGEIEAGIQRLPHSKKRAYLSQWLHDELLPRFDSRIIDIDTEVMLRWGELTGRLKSKGISLPIMDTLIGASSLVSGCTLITRNEKDFRHMGISIINPFTLQP